MSKEFYRREKGVIRYYPNGVPDEEPKAKKEPKAEKEPKAQKAPKDKK